MDCYTQGGTRSIHDRGSDGPSYCKPKNYTSLKINTPKIPGIKISYPKKYRKY